MRKSSVRIARENTKIDWAIRDLVIKASINILEATDSPNEVHKFISYIVRKIYEDKEHVLATWELKKLFEKAGAIVTVGDVRSKLGDLLVFGVGRFYVVEVKPTPPPWGGMNPAEYHLYHNILMNTVVYCWREDGRWYWCPLEKVKFNPEKRRLEVEEKYDIATLLSLFRG